MRLYTVINTEKDEKIVLNGNWSKEELKEKMQEGGISEKEIDEVLSKGQFLSEDTLTFTCTEDGEIKKRLFYPFSRVPDPFTIPIPFETIYTITEQFKKGDTISVWFNGMTKVVHEQKSFWQKVKEFFS